MKKKPRLALPSLALTICGGGAAPAEEVKIADEEPYSLT